MMQSTQPLRFVEPVYAAEVLPKGGTAAEENSFAKLINREMSLIEFYRRVLDEGLDSSQPLLERLKLLAIFSSILDEFFMIRVSGLKESAPQAHCADGMTAREQFIESRRMILEMIDVQMSCIREDIIPELARNGIEIATLDSLTDAERQFANEYFEQKIYPLLTPQAVDPTHPFPYISGGALNVGLMIKPRFNRRIARDVYRSGDEFFARIKIPPFLPRLVAVEEDSTKFVLIEDLLAANVRMLMPDAKPENCHIFRITRDADIEFREDLAEDLLETMEEYLLQCRFGDVVRLEVSNRMPSAMVDFLKDSLEIESEDVYYIDGPLNIADLSTLCKLDRADLKDEPLYVSRPGMFRGTESAFEIIKRGDVLLHHPYMPYNIITDFIREAAADADVLAIKICLYRIGADSPIAPLLIKAAEKGKQVTVLIELKARFDEENNIEWAKKFERAGIHVIYGLPGLKTHCKTTLIIRREEDELKRYVHLATGNYNTETSSFYTDLGLLTVDDGIGADVTELFNFLSAYSRGAEFKKLLVAPINLRERVLQLIKRETENALNGIPARITAKMNRLADVEIVDALYKASQAGVEIDLVIRGICTLRPGVPNLSENIRVRSIVGRLLEHSRVYCFENGGNSEVYIGSSDWMPRNLDRRVEVLAPVNDAKLKHYLKEEFLSAYIRDNTKARQLMPGGEYARVFPQTGEENFDAQLSFQGHSNVVLHFDARAALKRAQAVNEGSTRSIAYIKWQFS